MLRFAVLTAISLGLAAATILLLIRHLNTAEAERNAAHQAKAISSTRARVLLKNVDVRGILWYSQKS